MHPAFSLIIFSSVSGVGFGLMAMLGIAAALEAAPSSSLLALLGGMAALGLAAVGLLASVFHLRRPERAWRAFSEWRSSWLSREGWLAVATMAVFFVFALTWAITGRAPQVLGIASAALAVATVFCTAMIYAQLRTVPRWHTPLTPLAFVLIALATGALALASVLAWFAEGRGAASVALVFLVLAAAAKVAWFAHARGATLERAGASIEAATGLVGRGAAKLFEAPHTGSNYLMHEMVYVVGRRRASALRKVAAVLGVLVPLVLLLATVAGLLPVKLLGVALLIQLLGIFAERWLFFAEAQHAVSAYYGHR
ncbi:MAG: DmsC/YnfH family molybdoenzyme membrane anchor subunit [Pseudomonadota bacterium]